MQHLIVHRMAQAISAPIGPVAAPNVRGGMYMLWVITHAIGNSLNNIVTGDAAYNNLFGLAGADRLGGRAGNGTLYGGGGGRQ